MEEGLALEEVSSPGWVAAGRGAALVAVGTERLAAQAGRLAGPELTEEPPPLTLARVVAAAELFLGPQQMEGQAGFLLQPEAAAGLVEARAEDPQDWAAVGRLEPVEASVWLEETEQQGVILRVPEVAGEDGVRQAVLLMALTGAS